MKSKWRKSWVLHHGVTVNVIEPAMLLSVLLPLWMLADFDLVSAGWSMRYGEMRALWARPSCIVCSGFFFATICSGPLQCLGVGLVAAVVVCFGTVEPFVSTLVW